MAITTRPMPRQFRSDASIDDIIAAEAPRPRPPQLAHLCVGPTDSGREHEAWRLRPDPQPCLPSPQPARRRPRSLRPPLALMQSAQRGACRCHKGAVRRRLAPRLRLQLRPVAGTWPWRREPTCHPACQTCASWMVTAAVRGTGRGSAVAVVARRGAPEGGSCGSCRLTTGVGAAPPVGDGRDPDGRCCRRCCRRLELRVGAARAPWPPVARAAAAGGRAHGCCPAAAAAGSHAPRRERCLSARARALPRPPLGPARSGGRGWSDQRPGPRPAGVQQAPPAGRAWGTAELGRQARIPCQESLCSCCPRTSSPPPLHPAQC